MDTLSNTLNWAYGLIASAIGFVANDLVERSPRRGILQRLRITVCGTTARAWMSLAFLAAAVGAVGVYREHVRRQVVSADAARRQKEVAAMLDRAVSQMREAHARESRVLRAFIGELERANDDRWQARLSSLAREMKGSRSRLRPVPPEAGE